MNTKIFLSLMILILILSFFMYNHYQISSVKVNKVSISSGKLNTSVRISQITDFHSNEKIDLEDIFKKVSNYNPHIIVLTGDIIDFKTRDLSMAFSLVDILAKLDKPIYYVSGNHELRNPLMEEFHKGLVQRGVIIAEGRELDLIVDNQELSIFGAGFLYESWDYNKLYKDINGDRYNILLSHSPNRPVWYLHEDIDLILSGHTHGGQVRLPFVGGLISPGEGFFPKYDKGLMKLDDHTLLYIDSGLGNSLLPMRFLNQVQISEISIN